MTPNSDDLPEHVAYTAAWSAKNDAALDLKLINDAPAADLSHGFKVLTAMLNLMDLQVVAIHASDRLKVKVQGISPSRPDVQQALRQERDELTSKYEQLRLRAAEIIRDLETLPSVQAPNLYGTRNA